MKTITYNPETHAVVPIESSIKQITSDEALMLAKAVGMKFSPAQFSGVLECEASEFEIHAFANLVASKHLLAAPAAEEAKVPWVSVIDSELVGAHLDVADAGDDFETAKRKLNSLISWHIAVATDPAVNGGYKLVKAEEAPQQEPDLSGLSQYAKETIRDWLKDGTFVERAIGVMRDQEQELMRYEKQQPASNGVTNTQEPSSGGVLFAVEEAIRNGDCPWQIEQAFDEYEAERKAAIGIRGEV